MTDAELEQFKQLAIEAKRKVYQATFGVWEQSHASLWVSGKVINTEYYVMLKGGEVAIASNIINPFDSTPSLANAEFIAYSHNNIETMANAIESLVSEVKKWQETQHPV